MTDTDDATIEEARKLFRREYEPLAFQVLDIATRRGEEMKEAKRLLLTQDALIDSYRMSAEKAEAECERLKASNKRWEEAERDEARAHTAELDKANLAADRWANLLYEVKCERDAALTQAKGYRKALDWLAHGEHEWSAPQAAIEFMERALAAPKTEEPKR